MCKHWDISALTSMGQSALSIQYNSSAPSYPCDAHAHIQTPGVGCLPCLKLLSDACGGRCNTASCIIEVGGTSPDAADTPVQLQTVTPALSLLEHNLTQEKAQGVHISWFGNGVALLAFWCLPASICVHRNAGIDVYHKLISQGNMHARFKGTICCIKGKAHGKSRQDVSHPASAMHVCSHGQHVFYIWL